MNNPNIADINDEINRAIDAAPIVTHDESSHLAGIESVQLDGGELAEHSQSAPIEMADLDLPAESESADLPVASSDVELSPEEKEKTELLALLPRYEPSFAGELIQQFMKFREEAFVTGFEYDEPLEGQLRMFAKSGQADSILAREGYTNLNINGTGYGPNGAVAEEPKIEDTTSADLSISPSDLERLNQISIDPGATLQGPDIKGAGVSANSPVAEASVGGATPVEAAVVGEKAVDKEKSTNLMPPPPRAEDLSSRYNEAALRGAAISESKNGQENKAGGGASFGLIGGAIASVSNIFDKRAARKNAKLENFALRSFEGNIDATDASMANLSGAVLGLKGLSPSAPDAVKSAALDAIGKAAETVVSAIDAESKSGASRVRAGKASASSVKESANDRLEQFGKIMEDAGKSDISNADPDFKQKLNDVAEDASKRIAEMIERVMAMIKRFFQPSQAPHP